MKKPYGYIYLVKDLKENKVYVGQKVGLLEDSINYYGSGTIISRIIKLRGTNFLKKIFLGYCYSKEELNISEIECIYFFRSFGSDGEHEDCIYGYNLTLGGEGVSGRKMTEEDKLKISENTKKAMKDPRVFERFVAANKNKKNPNIWNKGLTSETSEKLKNMCKKSGKTRKQKNIQAWNKGKVGVQKAWNKVRTIYEFKIVYDYIVLNKELKTISSNYAINITVLRRILKDNAVYYPSISRTNNNRLNLLKSLVV